MEVPRDLFERLVEAAIELRHEVSWSEDEERERSELVDDAVALWDATAPDYSQAIRDAATRLQAFVRQHVSGQCRFLSRGTDCPCPLCDVSRLAGLAMMERKAGGE